MGAVCEEPDFSRIPHRWKQPDFDDSAWIPAPSLETVNIDDFMRAVGLLQRFPIRPRPIPLLYETPGGFSKEVRSETGILQTGSIRIPAGTSKELVLDAGVEVNCFPAFHFGQGRGSRVKIVYFEKFVGGKTKDDPAGQIEGITDTLLLDGTDVVFEPFWYRSFRFASVKI